MTRPERIAELRWFDNVGMLDGLDLDNMSEEDFSKLEAEVVKYSANRANAWANAFKEKKGGD